MIALSSRLALSRITTNRSGLDVLAVIAFAVTAFLALTVAGGTAMFVERFHNPPAALVELTTDTPFAYWTASEFAETYVFLAVVACAILIVPILSLGGGAARLGASGRSRRLASLRLIGMTGGEVVLMSVIESVILTVAGAVFGSMLFALSLPLWKFVSFHNESIAATEMVAPWWVNLAVLALIVALSAVSTVIGLQRVVISPLGVARRESPRALKFWRVIIFVGAIIFAVIASQTFDLRQSDIAQILTIGGVLLFVLFSVNLVGPWIIQLLARPLTRMSSPATLLGMRRLVAQPRDAWRNVAALAFIGFLAAFTAGMPATPDDPLFNLQVKDISTGTIITLLIGLIIAATSTLINQAAYTVDRAEQTVALTRMGTPRSVFEHARYRQVILPLVTTLGAAVPLGFLMMALITGNTEDMRMEISGVPTLIAVIIIGLALCIGAAAASRPIETKILTSDYRRND